MFLHFCFFCALAVQGLPRSWWLEWSSDVFVGWVVMLLLAL
jgi:hypothetical protein